MSNMFLPTILPIGARMARRNGQWAKKSLASGSHSSKIDLNECRLYILGKMIGQWLLHYQIRKRLGAGGQATAYLARDTRLDRTVVLKLLDPKMAGDETSRKRFLREARLAATLDHPNVCTVHEINEASGHHFIVMQYVDGETLKSLLVRKRLPVETVLTIALQVADGLAAAHRAGIVHRDVKTGNIIITQSGRPVILDFGLAKALPTARITDLDVTQADSAGKPFGTASYMSPEQARTDSVIDAHSDVFSFGIVLYEMLTGKKAFAGKNAIEVMHAILHDEPRPIREFVPDIDPEIERIVFRTLRKNPKDRYPSAVELLEELLVAATRLGIRDMAAVQALAPITRKRGLGKQLLQSAIDVLQSAASLMDSLISGKTRSSVPSEGQGTSQATASPSKTVTKLSLAILPLKNIIKNPEYEYFGVGLADTLITELAVVGDLIVRPLRTVFKYENQQIDPLAVGQEMGVDVVLDGSFQVAGGKLRATLRLFDIRTGEDIWTERFDHPLEDLFTLQDQVAQRIIEGLRIHLTDYEREQLKASPAGAVAAYDYYIRARYLFEKAHVPQDLRVAIDLFRRAIEMDRQFVPAYSGLAKTHFILRAVGERDPEWFAEAEAACREAIRLNPHFAESYSALANVYLERGRKLEAYEQLQTALKLAPHDLEALLGLGWFYRWSGLLDKAVRCYKTAIKIDPGYWRAYWGLAMTYGYLGHLDEAERLTNHFLTKINPQHPPLRFMQGDIWFHQGKYDQARRIGELMKQAAPDVAFGAVLLAKVYSVQRQADKANRELERVTRFGGVPGEYFYWRAQIYALQGKPDQALEYFQKSIQMGNENYLWFERDQTLDNLRADPQFIELMNGLHERWLEYQRVY
ncbi:MAG: protein kinase [Acidobacteria bacterium]|nr:protein kinase [Acidobacteriota bacterium]